MSLIGEFWKQLDGPIHPEDRPVLASRSHPFNLDYPPPAFVGDPITAPVVVLMANGGFDPELTPSEFPNDAKVAAFLEFLHHPRPIDANFISPYYGRNSFMAPLIASGDLAIINAVAYRSRAVPERRFAALLPSAILHRRWLLEEVLPKAASGERLIVVHRSGLWNLPDRTRTAAGLVFSTNPASPYLSNGIKSSIGTWLAASRH